MELTTTEIVVEVQPQTPTIVASIAPTELHLTQTAPDPEIVVALAPPPEFTVTIDDTPRNIVVTIHEGLPGKPGKDGTGGGGTGYVTSHLTFSNTEHPIDDPYIAGSLGEDILVVGTSTGFTQDLYVQIPSDFDKEFYSVVAGGENVALYVGYLTGWAGELSAVRFNLDLALSEPWGENDEYTYLHWKIPATSMEFAVRRLIRFDDEVWYTPAQTSEWLTAHPSRFITSESVISWPGQLQTPPPPHASFVERELRTQGVETTNGVAPVLIYMDEGNEDLIHKILVTDPTYTTQTIHTTLEITNNVRDFIVTPVDELIIDSVSQKFTSTPVPCTDENDVEITFPAAFNTAKYVLYCTGGHAGLVIRQVPKYPTPTAGNNPAAVDVTYANQTYPNVAAALDALLNPYVAPQVTLSGGSTNESGSTVNTVNLSFTVNKTCTKTIDQGVGVVTNSPVNLVNQGITSQRTYTITADDGTNQVQASTTVSFAHRRWFGPSAYDFSAGTFAQATLNSNGLSSDLSDSKSKGSVTYNCTGGKYPYLIVWGASQAVTATVNGFPFTDFVKTNIFIPDAAGVVQTYTCCKFNNIQNGTITVVWS